MQTLADLEFYAQNVKLTFMYLNLKTISQCFVMKKICIGNTTLINVNPEISPFWNYIVWIEAEPNGTTGVVWQCGIDPNTGDLIPSNDKGYSLFYSTIYARPGDWEVDSLGLYYVGQTIIGQRKFVRPTSPTIAVVAML